MTGYQGISQDKPWVQGRVSSGSIPYGTYRCRDAEACDPCSSMQCGLGNHTGHRIWDSDSVPEGCDDSQTFTGGSWLWPSTASGNNQTTDDLLKTLIELVKKQNQAKSNPQNKLQGSKSQIICYHCDQKGHIARQCPSKQQAQPPLVPVSQNQTTPALK